MNDSIKFQIILAHDDIREANDRGQLPELIASTVSQIRTDLCQEVQRWLAEQVGKARKLKGGTE